MSLAGFIPINKPVGLRSTQCVEMVRAVLGKNVKVGHGGTLDSTASGVLILLIGAATRLSSFVMGMPKRYEAKVKLGSETSTDDGSGDITFSKEWHFINETAIDSSLCSFMGWRMQAPPSVSAVHIDGKRAHELVRNGQKIQIVSKPVFFSYVKRKSLISDDGQVSFVIDCHKGTYIRSFARDIGRRLGTAAHIAELERTKVGPFEIGDSIAAEMITNKNMEALINKILPVETLNEEMSSYIADDTSAKRFGNGQKVALSDLKRANFGKYAAEPDVVVANSEDLFSVCETCAVDGQLKLSPVVNIFKDRCIEG